MTARLTHPETNTATLDPSDPWPAELRLSAARRYLADGMSLGNAADLTGFLKADLDRALWNTLGARK